MDGLELELALFMSWSMLCCGLWVMTDDVLCVVRVTTIKVLFIFSLAGTECH